MRDDGDQMADMRREPDGSFSVQFERVLRHEPRLVWEALTDPRRLEQWFTETRLEPGIGGAFRADFGPEGVAEGEVLAWEPSRLLEYSWIEGDRRSVVRWELEPEAGGTRLRLSHSETDEPGAADYAAGWHDFLDRLPLYLAGDDLSDWRDRYATLKESYAARL